MACLCVTNYLEFSDFIQTDKKRIFSKNLDRLQENETFENFNENLYKFEHIDTPYVCFEF